MANQIIRARYISNNGTPFVTGVNSEVLAQDDGADPPVRLVGATTAPVNGLPPLPRQMKPRRAVCYNPAGKRREIILLSADAPLATPGTEITLEDSDGAATVYTCDQVKNESFRARRKAAAV